MAGGLGTLAGLLFLAGQYAPRSFVLNALEALNLAIAVQVRVVRLLGLPLSLYESHAPAALLTRDWLLLLALTAVGARAVLEECMMWLKGYYLPAAPGRFLSGILRDAGDFSRTDIGGEGFAVSLLLFLIFNALGWLVVIATCGALTRYVAKRLGKAAPGE